jgi:photosystem II stability/assembly factor-like uncharacterized protein
VNPASASFITDTAGWVLGASSCASGTCAVVVTTADGGATWKRVAAPASSFADLAGPQGSPRIRFANAKDGWILGAHLWATHDGGAAWKEVTLPASAADSQPTAIAVTGTVAWLLTVGGGADLLRTPVSSDAWAVVPQTASTGTTGRLEGSGSVLWEWLTGQAPDGSAAFKVFATADAGATWAERHLPCPAPGGIALGDGVGLVVCGGGSAAGSQEKQAYLTHDDGQSFSLLSNPPFGGSLWGVGLRDASTLFVAAVSGATFLYGSSDAGATWSTVFQGASGGAAVSDLAFPSKSRGVFVLGYASDVVGGQPSVLMMSNDGGASWQVVPVTASGT